MIFVTVGTNEAPFDRLLVALPSFPGQEVLVQHGASSVRPEGATCVSSLPYEEVVGAMRRADVVITHAGVGSVLTALTAGKRPVIVPRLKRFGEAVDDHQLEFARQMASTGMATVVEDPALLHGTVMEASESTPAEIAPSRRLVAELRAFLDEAIHSR